MKPRQNELSDADVCRSGAGAKDRTRAARPAGRRTNVRVARSPGLRATEQLCNHDFSGHSSQDKRRAAEQLCNGDFSGQSPGDEFLVGYGEWFPR